MNYESPFPEKAIWGLDRHAIDPKDYPKLIESRKIKETFLGKMDIVDTRIYEFLQEKETALVLKEHYYKAKEEKIEKRYASMQAPKVNFLKPTKLAEPTDDKQDDIQEDKPDINLHSDKPSQNANDFSTEMTTKGTLEEELKEPVDITRLSLNAARNSDADLREIVSPKSNPERERDDDFAQVFDEQTNSEVKAFLTKKSATLKSEIKMPQSKPVSIEKQPKTLLDETITVVFLLHGLQASSDDLRNLQSLLMTKLPDHIFYRSEINEEMTHESIDLLGARFAGEARRFLDTFLGISKIEISFIGHSMGGLIVRAALPLLRQYKHCFKTYISLSTPHLGAAGSKFLVSAGMKVLGQMRSNQSIRQISLDDEEQYLLALSRMDGLGWFKNVVFAAVHEDGYVAFESSLIHTNWKSNPSTTAIEIAKNIISQLNPENLIKLKVHVPGIAKGFDVFLGRQAHMEFLENIFLLEITMAHVIKLI